VVKSKVETETESESGLDQRQGSHQSGIRLLIRNCLQTHHRGRLDRRLDRLLDHRRDHRDNVLIGSSLQLRERVGNNAERQPRDKPVVVRVR
jgi:hypothetical protein